MSYYLVVEIIALGTLIACHGILFIAAAAVVRSLARHNREK